MFGFSLLSRSLPVLSRIALARMAATQVPRGALMKSSRFAATFAAFVPGLFFIALALSVIFAPKLILSLLAGFFVFLGCLAMFGAWKLIQFKRKISEMAGNLQNRVFIQGIAVRPNPFEDLEVQGFEEEVTKKTILH